MSRETALVTADWVEDHLNDPSIVLIEVDEDVEAYDKGHIPGAIKLDWKKDLQDGVRHDPRQREGLGVVTRRGLPVTAQVVGEPAQAHQRPAAAQQATTFYATAAKTYCPDAADDLR